MDSKIRSEDDIIRGYLAPLAKENKDAFDLLDDCALIRHQVGTDLVISTDAIAEGVHFLLDDKPEDIGWKALAVSVSDLAAKGAEPLVYQMALSFPQNPTHDFLKGLTKGLADAQQSFGIQLSGGDCDRRPGPLSITITVIGEVPYNKMVHRTGARIGDNLFVSGTLGEAALGLKIRRKDINIKLWNLNESEIFELEKRYLRPKPRLDVKEILRQYATSAIDLSDGLYKDLHHLTSASKCGAEIQFANIPLNPIVRKILNIDRETFNLILNGGDDYEILFSVPNHLEKDVKKISQKLGVSITKIGTLTNNRQVKFLDEKGSCFQIDHKGWDHFLARSRIF